MTPAKPAPAAPLGELEAIPALGASLLARPASAPAIDTVDAANDVLCRKGSATTSRWRSYDHKEAFQPAQAATAPPSDADVMGSWVKYDGSVPVTTPLDQAVRDEELPTSWTKYDEKPPLASLLESKRLRSKAPIYLAEVPPPAPEQPAEPEIPAAPTSVDRAEPQPAPRPAEPVAVAAAPSIAAEPATSLEEAKAEAPEPALESASSAVEIPAAPAAEFPDQIETQTADSLSLSADPAGASEEPAEAVASAPTPMPEAEAAPVAPVEEPPVPMLATPSEPMATAVPLEDLAPVEAPIEPAPAEPLSSEFVAASNSEPEVPAAPIAEAAAEVPEFLPLPSLPTAPEIPSPAHASTPEPPDQHEPENPEVAALSQEPEEPAAEIAEAAPAPMAHAEPVPAVFAEEPPVLAAPAEPVEIPFPAHASTAELPDQREPENAEFAAPPEEPEEPAAEIAEAAPASMAHAEPAPAVFAEEPPVLAAPTEPMAILPPEEPPRSEASIEPEGLGSAVTTHEPEQPALAPDPDVETRPAAPAFETAAEAPAPRAEPEDQREPPQMAVSAVKKPGAAKKAMLARLADMLELALSAKRSARNADNRQVASEVEAPARSTGQAEISETDAVVSVEAPIDLVLPAPTDNADAVQAEAVALPEAVSTATAAAPPADPSPEIADSPELQPSVEAGPSEPAIGVPESLSIETDEPLLEAPAMVTTASAASSASGSAASGGSSSSAAVATADALPQEPATESVPDAPSPVSAEPAESSVSPEELVVADIEPPPVHTQEHPAAIEPAVPDAPSAEDPVPLAAEVAPRPAEHLIDGESEAAAPIEAGPVTQPAAAEASPAPVSLAPTAPIDKDKAARDALASNLADVIHNVLSTTQFATRAMKADRYSSVQAIQATAEPEPEEPGDADEIAADALPHPVAIRSRLGRMERALALLSLGMMILVGYFAVSLWRDDGMVAAQAPVTAPAVSSSPDRGNLARGLGAAAIDASKTSAGPATGEPRPGDRR